MKEVKIKDFVFIGEDFKDFSVFFSTAVGSLDFSINGENFNNNIDLLKKIFNVKDIGYNKQIHSDIINVYDGNVKEGDAIISDISNIALGIFTADCVPILFYDEKKQVMAAVHSGWKGTLNRILTKSIKEVIENYGCKSSDIKVFIGPHIMACCYEVGDEVINAFKNDSFYVDKDIFKGRNLSLKNCILEEIKELGISESNIKILELCTCCNSEYTMHSYRRDKTSSRIFSFILKK